MNYTTEYLRQCVKEKNMSVISTYLKDRKYVYDEILVLFIDSKNTDILNILFNELEYKAILPTLVLKKGYIKEFQYLMGDEFIHTFGIEEILMHLCEFENIPMLSSFLKNKSIQDSIINNKYFYENALYYASEFNHVETAKTLLNHNKTFPNNYHRALSNSVYNNNHQITYLLFEFMEKNNKKIDVKNIFSTACAFSNIETIKLLEEKFPDINLKFKNCLLDSCMYNNTNVAKYFISKGHHAQTKNNVALKWACHNGNLELCQFLVEHGADIQDKKSLNIYQNFISFFQNINILKRSNNHDFLTLTPLEFTIKRLKANHYNDESSEKTRNVIQYLYSQYTDKNKAKEIIQKNITDHNLNLFINFSDLDTKLKVKEKTNSKRNKI